MMRTVVSAVFALLVPPVAVSAAELSTIGRDIGQIHPEIILPSLDGKRTLALSDYRGKKVILIEYASW
jgi:hypothetical protein